MKTAANNNKGGNLYAECAKGNFEKTLLYLKKNSKNGINCKIGISLFSNCCQACIHHQNTVSEEDLYEVLNSLLPLFNNLEEKEISSYVKCVYHFVKFFCTKGKKESIVQMEDVILPKFLLPAHMQTHSDIYHYITTLLYNLVANSLANTFDLVSYKICLLILKICPNCLDATKTCQILSNCFKILKNMNVPVDYMMDYYQKLLKSLVTYPKYNGEQLVVRLVLKFTYEMFYLYTSSQNFEKAEEFISIVDEKLKNVNTEYVELLTVLKMFVIYSPIKKKNEELEIEKCIEELKVFSSRFKYKKEFVDYVGKILSSSIDYYISNSTQWLDLTEKMQLQYVKFFNEYFSLVISLESQTNDWKNTYVGLNYGQHILQLVKATIQNKKTSLMYHQICIEMLKRFLSVTETLKMHNLDTWKIAWKSLSITMYNIGINLGYNKENCTNSNQDALPYLYLLLKYFIILEGQNDELVIKFEALEATFITIIDVHCNDVNRQLAFISLGIFFCRRNSKYFVKKWIDLKYSFREQSESNEDMNSITLVSALEAIQKDLPDLKLDNSDKIYLLNFELEFYKERWKSAIPMLSTIKHLRQIAPMASFANTIVKLFVDSGLLKNENFHTIIEELLESCKNTEDTSITSEVNLAILYFVYYKSCHRQIIKKNAKDMEKVASVEPPTGDFDPSDPVNSNQEYDILSNYESLNLEIFKDVFNKLEQSLEVFTLCIEKLTTDLEHITLIHIFNILLDLSLEFRLISFNSKSVEALELALFIAKLLKNAPNIIKTIALILDQTDAKNHLIDKADDILDHKEISTADHLEVCVSYYISKSQALLYKDINKSHEILLKAKELFAQVQENSCIAILKCRLLLLASKFSMLPCNLRLEPHENSPLMNIYSAAEVMRHEYKNVTLEDAYILLMLIQAKKELVDLNHYLKCPREVRYFGKDILLLMQRLVLPLHTVSYLLYLAHADLCLDSQDNCNVKVKDITTILNIKSKSSEKDLYKRYSPSSPSFAVPSDEDPCTVRHATSCDCYYCTCYEYQYLVLEKVRLSALIYVKENNFNAAQVCFQSALDLYDNYVKKYSKNRHQVPDFLPSYGYVLLNYSSHLWRTKRGPEAFDWNRTLLSLLEEKKLQYIQLYSEALVQKLGYLTVNIVPEPTTTLQEQMDRLQVSNEAIQSKTPENKLSKVSIAVDRSNIESAQKLQVIKRLPFTFASPEPLKTNKSANAMENTPAPKIQIYTEASIKKTRRKPVQKVAPNYPPIEIAPEATQGSLKSCLKSRTRLLTAKLKQSIKNPESETNNNESGDVIPVSTRNQARKNLLKEMSAPEPDTKTRSTGAVRKTRKK